MGATPALADRQDTAAEPTYDAIYREFVFR
jgi:hypothetical protein